jgi:hypothetical protein
MRETARPRPRNPMPLLQPAFTYASNGIMRILAALACGGFALLPALAQPPVQQPGCPTTAAYSLCEMVFDLNDQEAQAHPNPYVSVQLQAEFRSPRHKTYLMPAFWAGGRRMIIRFAPNEGGQWDYRLTSNLARFNDKEGSFQAADSDAPGFVFATNLHHFATLAGENISMRKPHLWMGDTCYRFSFLTDDQYRQLIDTRASQNFNHLRGLVIGGPQDSASAFTDPSHPVSEYFARVDARLKYANSKGIVFDLIMAGPNDHLIKLFPDWESRQRYVKYLIARYSAMNITWQVAQDFESYSNSKPLMKEIGNLLKQYDPFQHARSCGTSETSASLGGDQWMNYMTYSSSSNQLGAIEHQLYPVAFVNLQFGIENSGAGGSGPEYVDAEAFRHRLWNSTMNGQYPTYANSGTMAGSITFDPKYLAAPGAQVMSVWYKFFADTRHWELEPYFDIDGARAIALEGVEYIVYIEKPQGPIEIAIEKHGYDVSWVNPATGEVIPMKKFKGDRWTGEAPDRKHDWVLHIEREGRKESMLNRYKFDSREIPLQLQVPEQTVAKIPFVIAEPSADQYSLSEPGKYSAKLKRETRATRSMMYLWTGEVPTDGQGYRVLGTGAEGSFTVPPNIVKTLPNVLALHLVGMNANGKIYIIDKVLRLVK